MTSRVTTGTALLRIRQGPPPYWPQYNPPIICMNPLRISDHNQILRVIARLNIGGRLSMWSCCPRADRLRSVLWSPAARIRARDDADYALSRGPAVHYPEIVGEFSLGPREMRALVRLYRLIRQERPQVVHTHTAKAGFVGRLAARLARVPVVVHTFHGHVLHGYYGPCKTQLLRRMERGLAGLTDRIVTVSEQVSVIW